jgi:hypothetical protein
MIEDLERYAEVATVPSPRRRTRVEPGHLATIPLFDPKIRLTSDLQHLLGPGSGRQTGAL